MTSNNQGGGPWGSGQNPLGKNPWGNNSGNNGGNRGGGNGPRPPEFGESWNKVKDFWNNHSSGNTKMWIWLVVLAIIVIWGLTGIYRVQQDEKGVVLRFGKWTDTTEPGLRYHWPYPIEQYIPIKVTAVNQVEIGFRSDARGEAKEVESESRMITGDKNFINVNFVVYWMIKDPGNYLFNVRNPERAVKDAAESAMRDVIGSTLIQRAMTEGREEIAASVRELLQSILDSYGAGIEIRSVAPKSIDAPKPVVDAFNEVLRASADKDRLRNEAEAYRNGIIPVARGEAEKINQDALAYKESILNRAQGDAQRFKSIYESYKVAKDVTTTRMYIETMEQVLKNSAKLILGDEKSSGASPVVPYLPLPELKRQMQGPENAVPQQQQQPLGGHQ
jgi:modulator of FtsH protease HflK